MVQCIYHLHVVKFVLSLYNNNTSTFVSLQNGDTPLHIASANGHKAVVEVLLKAGADHSIMNSVSNLFKVELASCIVSIDLYSTVV